MALYHKWHVKNDFAFVLQFFSLTSDSLQGYYKVFRHLNCAICGWLVYVKKNCIIYQIFIGIIPTFSEKSIQFTEVWPELRLQTWSKAIFKIYTSLDHFIIDIWQPPKWVLEAAIDRLKIQLGIISLFNQIWISSLSMAASKINFWRLSLLKCSIPV